MRSADWRAFAEGGAADAAATDAAVADAAAAEASSTAGMEGAGSGVAVARRDAQPGAAASSDAEAGAYAARVAVAEAAEPRGWWGRRHRCDKSAAAQPTGALPCTCFLALLGEHMQLGF